MLIETIVAVFPTKRRQFVAKAVPIGKEPIADIDRLNLLVRASQINRCVVLVDFIKLGCDPVAVVAIPPLVLLEEGEWYA